MYVPGISGKEATAEVIRQTEESSFQPVLFFQLKEKTKLLLEECPNGISVIFWQAPVVMGRCPEETAPNIFALNFVQFPMYSFSDKDTG